MARLSLRTKLFGSFILILLPVLGLLIYGYLDANESRVEAALDDQMRTTQAVAALVDASFDEAFALAWALANDPLIHTLDQARLDPLLEPLAPHFPQFEAISAINPAGDNVGSSLRFSPESQRLGLAAGRPYFDGLMVTGSPVLSEVLISRRTSRPTIIVAVPIQNEDGKTEGAVIVTLLLEALSRRLEGVAVGPDQEILLADGTGTMAFYTPLRDLPWEKRDLSDFEPVKGALQGGATRIRSFVAPLSGQPSLGAFAPTPKYGWVVGVTTQEDVALAPIRIALRDQLLGFVLVAILSVALVLISSRNLLRPIRALTRHAVALGRGNLAHRANIRTGDEMEELGKSFDRMAERLEQTLNDLRRREEENARLYEEVRQTLHLRDEFLSVAAHEMKTPITSLRGYAQLLLRSKAARPPDERSALEVIERQTRRVARLTEDLLETVSPSAKSPDIQEIDLASMAEEMAPQAERASDSHRLMVCRPGPAPVNADPEMMRRVLLTLLDNAIRFSPEGGLIEVTVTAEEGKAVVSVRDHGQGIPNERRPHVFEPFYEPFPTGTPGYYGATGLGLYVVKTIIERHGGRVWFESAEGQGSTFYFSLPLRTE